MIGIDEAGRGSWAGPLLAVAIRLKGDWSSHGLDDSKRLNRLVRERISSELNQQEADIGYGLVEAKEIDKHGLTWAQVQVMKRAIIQIKPKFNEEIIVDGRVNYLKNFYFQSRAVIKADQKYLSVMAASILAKVRRDQIMVDLDKEYPGYDFAKHKGYGTKLHRSFLETKGPSKVHRLSYRPLKELSTKLGHVHQA